MNAIIQSLFRITFLTLVGVVAGAAVFPYLNLSFLDERPAAADYGMTAVDPVAAAAYKDEFMKGIDQAATFAGRNPDDVEVIFYEDQIAEVGTLASVSVAAQYRTHNVIEVYLPVAMDQTTTDPRHVALHEYGHILQNEQLVNRASSANPVAYTVSWGLAKRETDAELVRDFPHTWFGETASEHQADCFAWTVDPDVLTFYTINPQLDCSTPAAKSSVQELTATA